MPKRTTARPSPAGHPPTDEARAVQQLTEAIQRAVEAGDGERSEYLERARAAELDRLRIRREREAAVEELNGEGRFEEALDVLRASLYGYDPGPSGPPLDDLLPSPEALLRESLKVDPRVTRLDGDDDFSLIEREDHTIEARISSTKLGPVTVILRDTTATFGSLISHFAQDCEPSESESTPGYVVLTDEAQRMARVAAAHLREQLLQYVRDFTSRSWADAISHARLSEEGFRPRVERLEDSTNAAHPFGWDNALGKKPMSARELAPIRGAARQLRWEHRRANLRVSAAEFLERLQAKLTADGVTHRGRVPSVQHLAEILNPAKRKTPRRKAARTRPVGCAPKPAVCDDCEHAPHAGRECFRGDPGRAHLCDCGAPPGL